jgi:hypothetical protein
MEVAMKCPLLSKFFFGIPAPQSWGVKNLLRRKKIFVPTDGRGVPDYKNIKITAKECRVVSTGKVIKAFVYF